MGGVADPRIGDAADGGGIEIDIGHFQLREHQLGHNGSMAHRQNMRVLHEGTRGLQQRDEGLVGFYADGFSQMYESSRISASL